MGGFISRSEKETARRGRRKKRQPNPLNVGAVANPALEDAPAPQNSDGNSSTLVASASHGVAEQTGTIEPWATEARFDDVGGECIGYAHENEETRNKRVRVAEPLRMLDGQPKQQLSVSRWGRRAGIHPPTEVTVAEVAEAWQRWEGGTCNADLVAAEPENHLV